MAAIDSSILCWFHSSTMWHFKTCIYPLVSDLTGMIKHPTYILASVFKRSWIKTSYFPPAGWACFTFSPSLPAALILPIVPNPFISHPLTDLLTHH